MLSNQVLAAVRSHEKFDWSAIQCFWLATDCGPHFRSYENVAHYGHTLVTTLEFNVNVLYLGEQHGKGSFDRLFGWTNRWLQDYLQENSVHGISNLVEAYHSHGPKYQL